MSFEPKWVEDSASQIRITDFQAYPLGQKAYVKIATNMEVEGWGEINNMETEVACQLARSLSEMIMGENPTRIEHHWQRLFRAHRNLRGGGLMVHTISAIDMALWDIAGKLWRVPVYRLLGGPCRDRIWRYPSPKAIKIGPGGSKPFVGTPTEIADLVGRVKQARERVGPDGAVMFDAHSCLPPPILQQFARHLESDSLLFLEEHFDQHQLFAPQYHLGDWLARSRTFPTPMQLGPISEAQVRLWFLNRYNSPILIPERRRPLRKLQEIDR